MQSVDVVTDAIGGFHGILLLCGPCRRQRTDLLQHREQVELRPVFGDLPSTTRLKSTPENATSRPVAGTPWNVPRCVPVIVQRLATLSRSATEASALICASGKAPVNSALKAFQPSLSSGTGIPDICAT